MCAMEEPLPGALHGKKCEGACVKIQCVGDEALLGPGESQHLSRTSYIRGKRESFKQKNSAVCCLREHRVIAGQPSLYDQTSVI